MATDVDQAYGGWSHEKLPDHDENRDVSVSQMLDHGSISFGRFASESLEWERRSVFNDNKCQEELQKLKCPGLVAQKRAFFEEHFKKIRAHKVMQDNQQMELTVEYGADDRMLSQTGEENKSASHLENLGNRFPNSSDARSKESSIEVTLEEKHNSEAIQMKQLDLEYPSVNLASLHGRRYSNVQQTQHLDMGSMLNEPFVRTEEVKQHYLSDFDGKEGSREYYKSEAIAKKGENFTYAVQVCGLERESFMHKSLVRTDENQEIKVHGVSNVDVKRISRKYETTELEVSDGGTVLYPRNSNAEKSELKECSITVLEKSNPILKRYKNSISVPNHKGPAASVNKCVNVKIKSQSEIKSSREPKYSFVKGASTVKNSVGSDDTAVDEVPGNHKSTPFAPSRPLAELHSNVTNFRLVSSAIERQSAVSKDAASRCGSKMQNRFPSLPYQSKDVTSVQDISNKASIAQGVKGRGLENKRGCAVVRKRLLTLEKQCNKIKGTGADVPGPSKNRMHRCPNQPPHNQSLQMTASDFMFTNTGRMGKQEEVTSSATTHLLLHGRKPQIGGLSHIDTKPRKVIPPWR